MAERYRCVWRLTMGGVEEMRTAAAIAGASLCAIAVVPALAEGCADRLADNSPVKDVIACIKEQQDTIASLRQNLSNWSSDAPAPGNEVGPVIVNRRRCARKITMQ
jgi:hypothetical protein